jgi:uncharacterized protein (DUF1810 family)
MEFDTTAEGVNRDPFNLARFVAAQNQGDCFTTALAEIREGRKTGHWIWWVFPQMTGLGTSRYSHEFSISSLEEATAFLRQPVLGPRLRQITAAMNEHIGRSASSILGFDDVKLHSSMTLFMRVAPDEEVFRTAVDQFFGGQPDAKSDLLLSEKGRRPEP